MACTTKKFTLQKISCLSRKKFITQHFTLFRSNKTSTLCCVFEINRSAWLKRETVKISWIKRNWIILKQIWIVLLQYKTIFNMTFLSNKASDNLIMYIKQNNVRTMNITQEEYRRSYELISWTHCKLFANMLNNLKQILKKYQKTPYANYHEDC